MFLALHLFCGAPLLFFSWGSHSQEGRGGGGLLGGGQQLQPERLRGLGGLPRRGGRQLRPGVGGGMGGRAGGVGGWVGWGCGWGGFVGWVGSTPRLVIG